MPAHDSHPMAQRCAHPHLAALHQALVDEQRHQADAHAAALQLSLPERVAAGVSLAPLSLRDSWAVGPRTRLVLAPRRRGELHDGIGAGDRVVVAPVGSPDRGVRGVVAGVGEATLEITVDDEPPAGPLAVTRQFDPRTFVRFRIALERADAAPSPLRDALLAGQATWSEPADPCPEALASLEPSQRDAAMRALAAPHLAWIHGPPGTGKTTVLVALLRALVAGGDRPWALADSNAATDHLALRAAAAGLDVVRVGPVARLGAETAQLGVDARVARGPYGAALAALDRELSRLRGRSGGEAARTRRELIAERRAVQQRARGAVIASAQVIAATLGTLARVGPELPPAHTAVVDEATQAIEPAIWTAVPHVQRLILVGDPHQLGPVVTGPVPALAVSVLERLLASGDAPRLTVQRRMNAAIQDLLEPVYGSRLRPHPSVASHRLCELPGVQQSPLTTQPVVVVDTAGAGLEPAVDPTTRSTFNQGEVRLCAVAVAELRRAGVAAADIGVIAPYSAQVARLSAHPALAGVEVATVNAFQGREKEAIVVSFVRSGDGGLGFVADRRRTVVALSRARRALIAIGDMSTLAVEPLAPLVERLVESPDAWQSAWSPPWDAALP